MNLTVPLYVEERKRAGQLAPTYFLRPLFFRSPTQQDALLGRATSKIAADIRKLLDYLGSNMRHEELSKWSFLPDYSEERLTLPLDLRCGTRTAKALFVTFESMERKLAFTPALPELWFDVPKGQKLPSRATEVFTEHFRRLEKDEDGEVVPAELIDPPRAWTTSIELDVHPQQKPPKLPSLFAMLGGGEELDGGRELESVGRCLDWLYPDDLDRAMLRDAEVEELSRLLKDSDRRPVLLAGPRMVGKTTVIHECVWQRVRQSGSPFTRKRNVWHLWPQRLISGMSYVGQWENRLLAILKEAKARDHVLYFDDLLGLYLAGQTSNSDLSIAHVLRPYVERREVRILAEITPQSLRVLRERDRGMADLFHILPIGEPPPAQSLRIAIDSMRQLEGKHRCLFALDVLPTVIDLQRRYVRESAMPGKAAAFLQRLAAKYKGKGVLGDTVLFEFASQSGLSLNFLDENRRLERAKVIEDLSRDIIGQDDAVAAMADTISLAKARLNDPTRPLASFLFLGPTGVGKTQAAKALAKYLFGEADRLVRFDMNEYVDGAAVSRLVGTFAQPEGLLTSAVRRQPFCVVLLDEIEKADASVFDLLLQVLGEGRLTDSLGRTADFTNAIVILTSNLGVREASMTFGLRQGAPDRASAFVSAAERFFRPEFFNRVDRIVPFRALDRDNIAAIANGLIRNLFSRDGLLQRKCVLQVDPAAMERIIEQGFHPQLGARALKRAVENQLTRPIASTLATLAPGTPTVINVYPGRDGIAVHTQALVGIETKPGELLTAERADLSDIEWSMERVLDAADRIEAEVAAMEPAGAVSQAELQPQHYRYFALRDQVQRVRKMVQRLYDRLDAPARPKLTMRPATPRIPHRGVRRLSIASDHGLWRQLAASDQINQYIAELTSTAEPVDQSLDNHARQILAEAALLHTMASQNSGADRILLHIRAFGELGLTQQYAICSVFLGAFDQRIGFAASRIEVKPAMLATSDFISIEMPGAQAIFSGEQGTHLFFRPDGQPMPVSAMLWPMRNDDAQSLIQAHWHDYERWRSMLERGEARPKDDPWRLGPVVRVYDEHSGTVDLRTKLVTDAPIPSDVDLRAFILSRLSLPEELQEE